MKLNIAELAKQAGASTYRNRHYIPSPYSTFNPEQLEAFARLIVERCAVVCDELAELNRRAMTDSMWEQEECAAAIRQLLDQEGKP